MTLIELGEVSSGSPDPSAAPRRADIRRIAVAAVAALCVLTVTGSERPEPRSLPTLWATSVGNAPFTLTADTVYVLQETSTLTAYSAADGAPRWTRALPAPAGWVSGEVPGTLVLPMLSSEVVDGSAGPYRTCWAPWRSTRPAAPCAGGSRARPPSARRTWWC
jgi:outer membrane protein assembly factor BamB